MEPCIIAEEPVPGINDNFYRLLSTAMKALGIHSIYGPNWDKQVNLVCLFTGSDSSVCQELKQYELYSENNFFGSQETGFRQSKHLAQNYLYDEF